MLSAIGHIRQLERGTGLASGVGQPMYPPPDTMLTGPSPTLYVSHLPETLRTEAALRAFFGAVAPVAKVQLKGEVTKAFGAFALIELTNPTDSVSVLATLHNTPHVSNKKGLQIGFTKSTIT